jgi:hypothetical protein
MSHEDDREKFARGKGGALDSLVRFRIYNQNAYMAKAYRAAGRLEEAEKHDAIAQAAKAGDLSVSEILTGRPPSPPVPIAGKRRDRRESPE